MGAKSTIYINRAEALMHIQTMLFCASDTTIANLLEELNDNTTGNLHLGLHNFVVSNSYPISGEMPTDD